MPSVIIKKTLIILILPLLTLMALAMGMLVDWHARINIPPHLSRQELILAKGIIADTIPSDYSRTAEKRLLLKQEELGLILNFLLSQYHQGATEVFIEPGKIKIKLALRLTSLPYGPYLNAKLVARKVKNRFALRTLKVGSLHIPNQLSLWITRLLIANSPLVEYDRLFHQQIQDIQLEDEILTIDYIWDPKAVVEVASLIRNTADRQMVSLYRGQIKRILERHNEVQIPVVDVLRPLFTMAKHRSELYGDPVAENRALIVALSRHLHQRQLQSSKLNTGTALELNHRRDLAYHFISSAALAATSSEKFSNLIGFYKEIHDGDQGSGFSFRDMTANRAGNRFGEYAVNSPYSATSLQDVMSDAHENRLFMPETDTLPESMTATEFEMKFGTFDNPDYKKIESDIGNAISERAIYH